MIETTDSNIHSLDSLIERTLSRDAEATRARFAQVPNAQLTTKLALTTASRGLLRGLGSKLALYATGALLIGGAVYFIPGLSQQSSRKAIHPATMLPKAASLSLQYSSASAVMPPVRNVASKPVTPHPTLFSRASSPAHALKLDEGNGKNIPHIIDPRYGPPLR